MQACAAGQWMHCLKLMGQSLMARDFDRQVAEIQIRILCPAGASAGCCREGPCSIAILRLAYLSQDP